MDKIVFDLFHSFGCQSLLFSYGESSLEFFETDWFFFLVIEPILNFPPGLMSMSLKTKPPM